MTRVHLVGIGGAGLSAIATVLLQQGHVVSGSDLGKSPGSERLERMGATVCYGHAPENVHGADVVVPSSAVPPDNPELMEANRLGIPVVKRAEWLGRMMRGRRGIAVAGTHGKTTTTAMVALLCREAGLRPSFIVGGEVPELGANAEAGAGDLFVVEADEYDHTFLGLAPEVAVVTTLEWDHPDCYPEPRDMYDTFRRFASLVPDGGLLVGCGDSAEVRRALGDASTGAPRLFYGFGEENDRRAVDLRPNARGGFDFTALGGQNLPVEVSLAVPGRHNVLNSLAALVVADYLGVGAEVAKRSLGGFGGVSRRFEVVGEAGGVVVVDDYAHHPTEIRATLAGARARYPGREIWGVFQPHTFSRTLALLDDFAAAFSDADHVVVVDIFPSREKDDGSVCSAELVARMRHPDARYIGSREEAVAFLAGALSAGGVLITLGAGDVYRVGLEFLKSRGKEDV